MGGERVDDDTFQVKIHANPATKEGLAAIIAEMHNDIKWIKKEIEDIKVENQEALNNFKEDVERRLEDHEKRIADLETYKWRTIGAIGLAWAAITVIIGLLQYIK